MPSNTMTFTLNGDVSLEHFVVSMQRFQSLIQALTADVATGAAIEWNIEDLQVGSATATIIGIAENPGAVESVIHAYEDVGVALQYGGPINYSSTVRRCALALPKVLNGHIQSIVLETAEKDALILSASAVQNVGQKAGIIYSWGSVRGRVETITSRRGLRFTLYDSLFDRPVACYLHPDQKEKMLNIWGRKVSVSGQIGRYADGGRPKVIRQILEITTQPDVPLSRFEDARGILSPYLSGEKPEEIIRSLRDA